MKPEHAFVDTADYGLELASHELLKISDETRHREPFYLPTYNIVDSSSHSDH